MKHIIHFSLRNKFAVWLLTLIVTAAGLYAGLNMKQETLPNLDIPILTVTTVYPGAAPEDVLESVTIPLEKRIENLEGVKSVDSRSMENVSSLIVEYDYGQKMDQAIADVREAVESVTLPSQAQKPEISRISLDAFPVLSISVTDSQRSLEQLTELVEEQIKPALEGITGVASVQVSGQYVREVQLTFDQDKMNALGLSEETVKGIIHGSALKVPLGLFELGRSEKTVVVDGNVISLDDLKQLAIPVVPGAGGQGAPGAGIPGADGAGIPGAGGAGMPDGAEVPGGAGAPDGAVMPDGSGMFDGAVMPDGTGMPDDAAMFDGVGMPDAWAEDALPDSQGANLPANLGIPTVQLQEIANVELVGRAESISRTNGAESIGIQIIKAPDANTVEVVNRVKERMDKFGESEASLQTIYMLDQGEPIENSVATMLDKALFGALFAMIVILLFLRNFRTTLISIISIPLSLLIGLLILNSMDITLNMMTLGAMTVAIGRVVDDSIVVIENIYRRLSLKDEPLKGMELILSATREMSLPILSSTLVTIAVFLPLALVSGMVGELFVPFALTIVFAMLASLLVAITLVPMLGHAMFRKGVSSKRRHDADKPGALAYHYRKLLRWTLDHKAVTFFTSVALLAGSLFLLSVVGASFLPEEEQKYAILTYSPAPGELLEEVVETAQQAESVIMKEAGVENFQYAVGGKNPLSIGPSKSALFYVLYQDDVKSFAGVKEKLLDTVQQAAPGQGKWGLLDIASGMGGSNQMSLQVYGNSMEEIIPVTEQIRQMMEDHADFAEVETSISETYDQYTFVADQQKLSRLGLTAGQIAMALSPQREQPALTHVEVDGKSYEVKVQAEQAQYDSIQDMANKLITSPLGISIPIKDVAEIREGESPNTITMRNGRMYAEVTADVRTKDVAAASANLEAEIEKLNLPSSIEVKFGGVTEQIRETFTQLGLAMAAAVAVVYLVMVITFGGALAPFVILFSLPFAVIGILVALWIAGETLDVSALMGALMLIGIVVTNAIVLIDRVIRKEKEGLSTREALIEAGGVRLRPILMTALATIGALLPLAFGFDSAGMISRGLGITVIGGLASSTLLTLVIVPLMYEFLMKFRKAKPAE